MSPRAFDSSDHTDADPGQFMWRYAENVECPICFLVFEGEFHDLSGSLSPEDMVDPPIGTHTCPECGHQWTSGMTGWTFFSESG